MGKLENAVQTACLEYLKAKHIMAWRNNNQGRWLPSKGIYIPNAGMRGVSDIIGCLPDGRFLAVECKSANGKPSKEQVDFLFQIAQNGGVAVIVKSVGDLAKHLEESQCRK